jgi:hypothetical protein
MYAWWEDRAVANPESIEATAPNFGDLVDLPVTRSSSHTDDTHVSDAEPAVVKRRRLRKPVIEEEDEESKEQPEAKEEPVPMVDDLSSSARQAVDEDDEATADEDDDDDESAVRSKSAATATVPASSAAAVGRNGGSNQLHNDAYPFPWLNTQSNEPPPVYRQIADNIDSPGVQQLKQYDHLFNGCRCVGRCQRGVCACLVKGGDYRYVHGRVQDPAYKGISQFARAHTTDMAQVGRRR